MRAVAPPYPGAFDDGRRLPARVLRTRVLDAAARGGAATLAIVAIPGTAAEWLVAQCGGGGTLRIDALEIDARLQTPATLRTRFGDTALPLG